MIVRNDISHYLHSQVNKEYLQATTVTVQTSSNYFQLPAVCVPPRHKITSQMWEEYFQHLGDKYMAAGDCNSKHTLWGSRNTTPRDRTLEKYIRNNNLNVTPRGLPRAVFSNRRSRPYNVAVGSSYLTAGSYTMYRRAHSCRQAASSRNVEFGPLRFPRKNRHT